MRLKALYTAQFFLNFFPSHKKKIWNRKRHYKQHHKFQPFQDSWWYWISSGFSEDWIYGGLGISCGNIQRLNHIQLYIEDIQGIRRSEASRVSWESLFKYTEISRDQYKIYCSCFSIGYSIGEVLEKSIFSIGKPNYRRFYGIELKASDQDRQDEKPSIVGKIFWNLRTVNFKFYWILTISYRMNNISN